MPRVHRHTQTEILSHTHTHTHTLPLLRSSFASRECVSALLCSLAVSDTCECRLTVSSSEGYHTHTRRNEGRGGERNKERGNREERSVSNANQGYAAGIMPMTANASEEMKGCTRADDLCVTVSAHEGGRGGGEMEGWRGMEREESQTDSET